MRGLHSWFNLALGAVVIALGFGCVSTSEKRNPASFKDARELAEKELLKATSSGKLQISQGHVITDNDAAFESKIEAIRSARSGETIRMIYYIYANDESSAVFTSELLQAAARGVNVRLMVDYLTNYKMLDLFHMMEKKSGGRIQVRLYGRPNQLIMRDALFLTRPCPTPQGTPEVKFCSDSKWMSIQNELKSVDANTYTDTFSSLFLSGLSSKNPLALQASLLMGGQIDFAKYKQGGPATAEDQKQLMEFFKWIYEAQFKGDLIAGLKVQIALATHGEQLKPLLNEIYGRLPLSQMANTSFKDWEHLSDYTHHKVLLVEDRFFQLGGRNIENSYHMKKNSLSAKYIFMDTDFAAKVTRGGGAIAKSFDAMWNFSPMVADLKMIYKFAPHDFVANPDAAKLSIAQCSKLKNTTHKEREDVGRCLVNGIRQNGGKNLEERIENQFAALQPAVEKYQSQYLPVRVLNPEWKKDPKYSIALSQQDTQEMVLGYVENLHFKSQKPQERVYGALNGQEILPWRENEINYGKSIHFLWGRGLENACAASAADGKPRRVILHSAYFLPPGNLIRTFAKMMDGTWDCKNVHVTFLTNSINTTDLNIINVYARYQMKAFFDVYSTRKGHFGSYAEQRSAKFDYYEYLPVRNADGSLDSKQKISLHTKMTVLGDDVIVGSANADVRSFYMDTNNGVVIRNAKDMLKVYVAWIESILADPSKTKNLTPEYMNGSITLEKLNAEDFMFMDFMIQKYNLNKKIKGNWKEHLKKLQADFGKSIDSTTKMLLSKDYIEYYGNTDSFNGDNEKIRIQKEMEARFNRALQIL